MSFVLQYRTRYKRLKQTVNAKPKATVVSAIKRKAKKRKGPANHMRMIARMAVGSGSI